MIYELNYIYLLPRSDSTCLEYRANKQISLGKVYCGERRLDNNDRRKVVYGRKILLVIRDYRKMVAITVVVVGLVVVVVVGVVVGVVVVVVEVVFVLFGKTTD